MAIVHKPVDAIIVGAGPNGLAAGIELARAGKRVRIYEGSDRVGGGARSGNLTLPGFTHDICSAVHPLALSSPFFTKLDLAKYGLEFIEPPAALAHPFDDGTAVLLKRSVESTSLQFGRDAKRYQKLINPLVRNWTKLSHDILGPPRIPGRHTLSAYCHVPHGSNRDMSEQIEDQIERFAPGFRKLVLARSMMSPLQLEQHNPNLVGGDINGGAQILSQMFTRPTLRTYRTPLAGIYLCSSSTPPGGGVHGMCGYHAARSAVNDNSLRRDTPPARLRRVF
jgi:phytoene dehydrogenase-like protein